MRDLRSYVSGRWQAGDGQDRVLVNPSTEEPLARARSGGVDFQEALHHAREVGGAALRELSFAERGELLKAMATLIRDNREELLELSRLNLGATRSDGAFDVDGAGGTLAWYARLARELPGTTVLPEEGPAQSLGRSGDFVAHHAYAARRGVAIQINAFNFPVWGFAEKAATALLAGMPVVAKPATPTALVAERCVELILEARVLPEGALQLIVGDPGDLLDHVAPQDVVAFTGSAATARVIRSHPGVLAANPRVNVEADSLNAAVLAPGAHESPALLERFLDEVVREMTQKTGQKCTAVRRILVTPEARKAVLEGLRERLDEVIPGLPGEEGVTMGPLATERQLNDCLSGIAELQSGGELLYGSERRCSGRGVPMERGYFLAPVLLDAADAHGESPVHHREVFGPVASLIGWNGDPVEAGRLVGLAGGTLVTSVYGDDPAWLRATMDSVAPHTGRAYVVDPSVEERGPGSGAVFPMSMHGGPGRAGGGAELGGLSGVHAYMQPLAVQGPASLDWARAQG
ncbi:MAG: 3,4-dehydroadipyl-CoA semialdehyde dehydrogenase [Gemmatimonadota bacterium]